MPMLPCCVTSGKTLNLSDTQFPQAYEGSLAWWLGEWALEREFLGVDPGSSTFQLSHFTSPGLNFSTCKVGVIRELGEF